MFRKGRIVSPACLKSPRLSVVLQLYAYEKILTVIIVVCNLQYWIFHNYLPVWGQIKEYSSSNIAAAECKYWQAWICLCGRYLDYTPFTCLVSLLLILISALHQYCILTVISHLFWDITNTYYCSAGNKDQKLITCSFENRIFYRILIPVPLKMYRKLGRSKWILLSEMLKWFGKWPMAYYYF